LHVASAAVPRGVVATRPGTLLAASGLLKVTVRGEGGHGSAPHRAADPVPATCEMVTALQTMVTRRFDVFDPVVVTVGVLRAGTRHNVIPETAEFEATVRTFSSRSAARIADAAVDLVRQIAAAHGLRADVAYEPEYPLTVNDGAETGFLETTVREVFGEERMLRMPNPLTGSEDFSRVLDAIPGAMAMLGVCAPGADPSVTAYNHSPYAEFDDTLLADGAALYAELAMRRLSAVT
jgi:hippurate hydrolase